MHFAWHGKKKEATEQCDFSKYTQTLDASMDKECFANSQFEMFESNVQDLRINVKIPRIQLCVVAEHTKQCYGMRALRWAMC